MSKNKFYPKHPRKWRKGKWIVLIFITVFAIMNPMECVGWGADDQVAQYENINFGNDPRGFETAEEMYKTAPSKPYDEQAGMLASEMDNLLQDNPTLESNLVRSVLKQLEPYRRTNEVQVAAQTWKALWISNLKSQKPNEPINIAREFMEANRFYNIRDPKSTNTLKNLKAANEKYLEIVRKYPQHLDARNNLALSELHLGNDLVAQLELEVLREFSPNYAPALVNLTVVYERLGKAKQAETLAQETQQQHPKLPQAAFNAAWYLNRASDFKKSMDLLMPLVDMKFSTKSKRLNNIDERLLGGQDSSLQAPGIAKTPADAKSSTDGKASADVKAPSHEKSFWKKGLAGVTGGKTSWWAWILSIGVFLFISFFVSVIWGGVAAAASSKRQVPFFSTFIAGGFCFILFWGAPTGWGWVPLIIYAIFFVGVAAEAAKGK